ncbi:MAG TPA: FtsX-like permease family protein [Candidatus Acidoferrum sp.]|nr:FtsX-like permease family protein [Candidatus Acidoferrum sp.]
MLISLALSLAVSLLGAIDNMMLRAKTPHFLQMHSGEIDAGRLQNFAQKSGDVEASQVLEFLNVDGSQIVIGGNSLSGSVQDNGFSTQSKEFDYLMGLDGNMIQAKGGELYVPIAYMKDKTAKIGDTAVICGIELTVAGFLRDAQMNSALSSSKRFLLSEKDYARIRDMGDVEYLIEFRLKDISQLGAFEAAYISSDLPANGPTVTYPLFRMMNAVSDGLMIAILLLVSILVVAVAFLCIRFTLLAKIEEETREIGVMKAIGLRVSDIRRIYLAKYAFLALLGCLLGFILSLFFKDMLLENIRLYMGESENTSLAPAFGIAGVLAVFLFTVAFVSLVLRRFRRITPAEAVRYSAVQEKTADARRFMLVNSRVPSVNAFLGMKDVLTRKKLYATMAAVLVIAVFIMIVPQNIYSTISSKDFITYMGIGRCDMLVSVQQTDRITQKAAEIDKAMQRDKFIDKHAVFVSKMFEVKTENGAAERIKIELGDHSVFPIQYAKGRMPQAENEIALSVMSAGELGKTIGDRMVVLVGATAKSLVVCGIYSDITNGGKTAKAVFPDNSAQVLWYTVCADIKHGALPDAVVGEYEQSFPYAKVAGIEAYFSQVYGPTVDAVRKASYAAIAAALAISVLVILLFMKMLVVKDRYAIAVLKSLGFTNADIQRQYLFRAGFVLATSIFIGTILANTAGEFFGSALISMFGASSFKFAINPWIAYLLFPLLVAATVIVAAMAGVSGAASVQVSENIKE